MFLSTLDDINSLEYWLFNKPKLDNLLKCFYYTMRTSEGDHYKVSSIKNIWYSLNRCLDKYNAEMDIIKGPLLRSREWHSMRHVQGSKHWAMDS